DAVFVLPLDYMHLEGEDAQGFRAIAERSTLGTMHDNGGVSMFPEMADEWDAQVQAQRGWRNFRAEDYRRLKTRYGVSWVVLQRGDGAGLTCPYSNAAVQVCR